MEPNTPPWRKSARNECWSEIDCLSDKSEVNARLGFIRRGFAAVVQTVPKQNLALHVNALVMAV